jgi:hypothetical protein
LRFLYLDAHYPAALHHLYAQDSSLRDAPFEDQRTALAASLFGDAQLQADALRSLGHEADVVVTNATPAQRAWAMENGYAALSRRSWASCRRGGLPWVRRSEPGSSWAIVIEQVRAYRPDVLYVSILDTIPPPVLAQVRPMAGLVVGQIAAPYSQDGLAHYDVVLSSIPNIVRQIEAAGIRAHLVPLAFSPKALEVAASPVRDIPVSFVGSFATVHPHRIELLEAVAAQAPLRIWTADTSALAERSQLRSTVVGPAFGASMYRVLGRSLMTLNSHSRAAGDAANNLRLYEATGMGALLITDRGRNLGDLFDLETEVVAYRSATEAASAVSYFLSRPDEAARIAAAGQARTLRDHTWTVRMQSVVDLLVRALS